MRETTDSRAKGIEQKNKMEAIYSFNVSAQGRQILY